MKGPLFPYVVCALFAVAVAGLEWLREFKPWLFPRPWQVSGAAVLVIVLLVIDRYRNCKQENSDG